MEKELELGAVIGFQGKYTLLGFKTITNFQN